VPFEERQPVGIATTSFDVGKPRRSELVAKYLLAVYPEAEVYGKWDDKSLADVPEGKVIQNDPRDFEQILHRYRVTLALPALGTGWTVSKVWQCYAANVVTFLVGGLDDQGWILPSRIRGKGTKQVAEGLWSLREDWSPDEIELARAMRVSYPSEFGARVLAFVNDKDIWEHTAQLQRSLLTRRWSTHMLERQIEQALVLR